METGEQETVDDADRGRGARPAREAARMKHAAARQRLPRHLGRRPARRRRGGETVRVAGWVHRRRDHGGLIFIDLRDRSGLLQLVFHPETPGEAFAAAERLRAEHVRQRAPARSSRREEGNVNPNLADRRGRARRGRAATLLAEAETPPFPVDEDAPVDETLRLRYRYLDLRRERMRDAIVLRHDVVATMRDVPGRARLPRGRDADPDALDARGRARLPRAQPAAAGRAGTRCRSRRSSSSSS